MKKYLMGFLIATALLAGPTPASAQAVIAKMTCAGTFQSVRYQGVVLADLWRFHGGTSTQSMIPFLMRGELHKIPGTVRLFGRMRDSLGRLVNFEVYLNRAGQGVGGIWVNGMRHRETHMRLVVQRGGFTIYLETGGAARFSCRV